MQERADHIAEWVRLTEAKIQPAQFAPVNKGGRISGGKPKEGGINAAVRELGIDRTEAQRAVKIASIAPEARKAADDAELKVRAERRMGQALRESERAPAGRPTEIPHAEGGINDPNAPPTLAEIGITYNQSSRYQGLAEIPDATFDAVVEAHHEADAPISAAAVARAAEVGKGLV